MSNTAQSVVATSVLTRARQRRWVRCDPPVLAFVWRGFLPLLGLLLVAAWALLPFARDDIEATVGRELREQLQAQGYGWVHVAVSGQDVVLSGAAPDAAAAEGALRAARGADCPSWAGRLTCAVVVSGNFTQAVAVAAPAPTAAQACEQSLAELLRGSKIEFSSGSATIAGSSAPLLDALARAALDCPGTIHVEGHTDAVGPPDANQALSQARAAAVRAALVARGLAAERVVAEGYGAQRPLADNATDAGRAQNRRIEFRVQP